MGEVIDFASAVQRRGAERRDGRQTLAEACRADIINDACNWPSVFTRRIESELLRAFTAPANDPNGGIGWIVRQRARAVTHPQMVAHSLNVSFDEIRRRARELRAAQHRPRAARIRARKLRAAKDGLLWFLFEYGFRKVPRKLLAEIASGELSKERAQLRELIEHETAALCLAHVLAAGGVCNAGPRAGQPFNARYLKRVRACAERAEERLRSARARLAYLESSPPAPRRVGFYE